MYTRILISTLLIILFTGCGVEPVTPTNNDRDPTITDGEAFLNFNGCKFGSASSCFQLALKYAYGDGMPYNTKKAIEYYRKSCQLKSFDGCQILKNMDKVDKKFDTNIQSESKNTKTPKNKDLKKDNVAKYMPVKKKITQCDWQDDTYDLKISFIVGSTDFSDEKNELAKIEEFASCLREKSYDLEIQGYVDPIIKNQKQEAKELSQQRADLVMNKLIGYGVKKDNMNAVGYGDVPPVTKKNKAIKYEHNNRILAVRIYHGKMNSDIPNGKRDIHSINIAKSLHPINVKNADLIPVDKADENDILVPIDKSNPSTLTGYYEFQSSEAPRNCLFPMYRLIELMPSGKIISFDPRLTEKVSEWKDAHWYYDKQKDALFLDFQWNIKTKCKAYLKSNRMQMTCSQRQVNHKNSFPKIDDEVILNKISFRQHECRLREIDRRIDWDSEPALCAHFSESTIRKVRHDVSGGFYTEDRFGTEIR